MTDKRASSPETNGGSELVLKKQKTENGAIVTATPKPKDVRSRIVKADVLVKPVSSQTNACFEPYQFEADLCCTPRRGCCFQ